jgi:hypothetical protein
MEGDSGAVRVRFGTGTTQDLPLPWAEWMLAALKDRQPVQFGKLLAEAALAAK